MRGLLKKQAESEVSKQKLQARIGFSCGMMCL
jgi:hypothetical protein